MRPRLQLLLACSYPELAARNTRHTHSGTAKREPACNQCRVKPKWGGCTSRSKRAATLPPTATAAQPTTVKVVANTIAGLLNFFVQRFEKVSGRHPTGRKKCMIPCCAVWCDQRCCRCWLFVVGGLRSLDMLKRMSFSSL